MKRPSIPCIVGPTSSGKSEIAFQLAKKLNGEIISCDSMQVYRDMDIITRPPAKEMLEEVHHYLLKCYRPEDDFNASLFVEIAERVIKDIIRRRKVPIMCGGTGLYLNSLIDGIFDFPGKDDLLREDLESIAKDKGGEFLHNRLKQIDPLSAERIHTNDIRRVIRAIEVYELTGEPISKKQEERSGLGKEYEFNIFALDLPRDILYEKINSTVDKMFEEGLINEVERLNKITLSKTASQALGLKEISNYLEGTVTIEEAREDLKRNTRRYAKKQLTWFRGDSRVQWIDANRPVDKVVEDILTVIPAETRI